MPDRVADLIPSDYVLCDYVLTATAIAPDGELVLCHRRSEELPLWNAMGMLTSTLDEVRQALHAMVTCPEDDD